MSARTYWWVAVLMGLPLMLLGIYFLSDKTFGPLTFWALIIPQAAWAIYWWSRRKKPSTR